MDNKDREHSDIMRAIGRIEGGMEAVKGSVAHMTAEITGISERIGKLEISDSNQNIKIGMVATIFGVVGSFLVTFGSTIFKSFFHH